MDSFAWASVSQAAGLAGGSAITDARGGALLPPTLGFHLPPPAELEHLAAARSSCFGAGSGAASSASALSSTSGAPSGHRSMVAGGDDAPSGGAVSGACSSKGAEDFQKRRRSDEDVLGTDQDQAKAWKASTGSANESSRDKGVRGEENGPAAAAAAAGKKKEKGSKEPDESENEGYIHVRARKGQATNRHSLAERLRREKISERMKLLQDIVPGCNKVNGKALMLDEIINYVQSLQRQVEFLSMKLATVNPRLGLNIEELLSKELSRFPGAPSSAPIGLSFSQEMVPKLQQFSLPGMLEGGIHGVASSNVFRTVMHERPHEKDLFREHISQMPRTSDGSFHDAAQMAFGAAFGSEHLTIRPDQEGFHI